MNNFVSRKHDKFLNKTTTTSVKLRVDYATVYPCFYIKLRHVSTPDSQSLLIDIDFVSETNWERLEYGNLILNINETKNIKLDPHLNGARDISSCGVSRLYKEFVYYNLSKEELLMLCNAKTIEYKLIGEDNYYQGKFDENMQLICQAMYNAVYDSSEFKTEIVKAEENQAKAKERENKAKAKAKADKRRTIIFIIMILIWLFVKFCL